MDKLFNTGFFPKYIDIMMTKSILTGYMTVVLCMCACITTQHTALCALYVWVTSIFFLIIFTNFRSVWQILSQCWSFHAKSTIFVSVCPYQLKFYHIFTSIILSDDKNKNSAAINGFLHNLDLHKNCLNVFFFLVLFSFYASTQIISLRMKMMIWSPLVT